MWLQVIFDLPTNLKKERRGATLFRNFLLNNGFDMIQYSVYLRSCGSKSAMDKYKKLVTENLPEFGKVSMLGFTDRQYELIESFYQKKKDKTGGSDFQFELF